MALETSLDEFNRIGEVFQIQPDAGTNTKTTTKRKYEQDQVNNESSAFILVNHLIIRYQVVQVFQVVLVL